MAKLPTPGGDAGNWGTILNDYLLQAHKEDGTLKAGVVAESNLAPAVVTKINNASTGTASNATTTTTGLVQLSGDLGGTATAPTVPGMARANLGGMEMVITANATGAMTINLASGNVVSWTLTGNVSGVTINGATNGRACSFTLYAKQDGTGNRTITWPASVKWSGGAPTLSTAANAVDIFVFESIDGGTTWYGSLVGKNFA